MKSTLLVAAFLFSLVGALEAQDEPRLTSELLKSLPEKSEHGLVPVLELEWSPAPVDQFALLVKFHTAKWHTSLFNVFGEWGWGCPYRIVVTDRDWNPVYQVLNVRPANRAIPDSKLWINADRNRILGKRFWRNSDWTCTSAEEFRPDPASLSEGDYLLHLVVTARLETEPPFLKNPDGNVKDQKHWRTRKLDRFVCRSKPISIQVGADGKLRRSAAVSLNPSSARVSVTVEGEDLLAQAIWITESPQEATNPGLRGITIDWGFRCMRPIDSPASRSYNDNSFHGKTDAPGPEGYRVLPKNAIFGFTRKCYNAIDPGEYTFSVTFPELFHDPAANPAPITRSVLLKFDGHGQPMLE